MLIAKFGPTTGWAGRAIAFRDEQLLLEGQGVISPAEVVEYDRQGLLVWVFEGMRAWVGARASTMAR